MIVTNWKMNLYPSEEIELLEEILKYRRNCGAIIICPSYLSIRESALKILQNHPESTVFLGGQDCATEHSGNLTGCVSAKALKESGCSFCIVKAFEANDCTTLEQDRIFNKIRCCSLAHLIPIICLQASLFDKIALVKEVREYAKTCLDLNLEALVFAYGATKKDLAEQDPEFIAQIFAAADLIKQTTKELNCPVKILYRGDLIPSKPQFFTTSVSIDGLFVENVSLNFQDFKKLLDLMPS